MEKIYKYKKRLYVKNIGQCDKVTLFSQVDSRKLLTINLRNSYKNVVTYVMLNPSQADDNISDHTVNRIIKHSFIHSNLEDSSIRVSKINVVNLFPFYETKSENLQKGIDLVRALDQTLYEDEMEQNFKQIKYALDNSQFVVLAWGEVPKELDKLIHKKQVRMDCLLLTKWNLMVVMNSSF